MTNRAGSSVSVVVPTYRQHKDLSLWQLQFEKSFNEKTERLNFSSSRMAAPTTLGIPFNEWTTSSPKVRGINLMRNYGNVLPLAGILNARHEVIVTMDDGFQTPPMEIPKLLGRLNEGYDLVYGARHKEPRIAKGSVAASISATRSHGVLAVD